MASELLKEKEPKKTWRKSVDINGLSKSVEVRQIENGFIVKYCKYGKEEGSEEYIDYTKEWFSKTNPLETGIEDSKEAASLLKVSIDPTIEDLINNYK
jgi:hypothetical protein